MSLSEQILENVGEVRSTKEMWATIRKVFGRHTLLKKLSARRKFYSASMKETQSILKFSNRIRPLAATLKSMRVDILQNEMTMALLNSLPDEFYG